MSDLQVWQFEFTRGESREVETTYDYYRTRSEAKQAFEREIVRAKAQGVTLHLLRIERLPKGAPIPQ